MLRQAASRALFVGQSQTAFVPRRFYAGGGDDAGSSSGKPLLLSFCSPYDIIYKEENVESVTVPAEEGRFGIQPDHVPTIAQLKPGIVEIVRNKESIKYVVGAGFVGMHPNSHCHVSVTECFPLSDIDKNEASQGLEEAKKDMNAASDEKAKAECRVRVETFEAILAEIA